MSFGFNIGAWQISWFTNGDLGPGDYRNAADQEIIGVKDALLFWYSNYGMGTSSVAGGGFTATVFDTSAYSDGAIVKLNNDSGGDRKIGSCAIHAKPVVRYSGEKGIKHDDFVDYESILRDGEKKLEFGNNYIVNTSQLESLCDHYWKANNYKRHVYQLEIPGRCYWYAPGEFYTVQIGGAGQAEYIDSVCECYDVQVECEAGGLGRTVVAFREVYQNWTKDSGALARFLGSGSPKDKYNFSRVLVASQYYPGPSDYRCDGTADQVEIQAAIDQIAGAGGGVVEFTEGQFNTTAAIDLSYDNVILVGHGAESVVKKNCNDYAVKIVGSAGTLRKNTKILDILFTADSADTNDKALVYISYAKTIYVMAYFTDSYNRCVQIDSNCEEDVVVEGCDITECGINNDAGSGLVESQSRITIRHNTFHDNIGMQRCIFLPTNSAGGAFINDNKLVNNIGNGIDIAGDNTKITGNYIEDCCQLSTMGAITMGAGTNRLVKDNICVDNGNLITNANCETTVGLSIKGDSQSFSGCTAERSTAQYYAGSYSHKITQTDASTGEYRFCDNVTKNDMHGLYAGTQYKLSAYTYLLATGSPTTAEVKLIVGYTTDAAGAWHETTGNVTTDHDAWGLAETTNVSIPSGAVGAKALVRINAAASTDEYIFIDNVRLQPIGTHNLHSQNFYDAGTATYVGV